MPLIIDGHNLIPHISGLSLQHLDDEAVLIELLEQYCRIRRQTVEVFFDQAAPGHAKTQTRGRVSATFVYAGSNADTAIRQRLKRLGRTARTYKVVSSDRQVQAEARAAGAEVVPSDQFARELQELPVGKSTASPQNERTPSAEEVDEWLEIFKSKYKPE